MRCLVLSGTDPYRNLATEEWAVRTADLADGDLLILYRNTPCVVVGRNQSIFTEVDLRFCREEGIDVCRRVSGGGAVYHDLGNWNITWITARDLKRTGRYDWFFAPLVRALADRGIEADLNHRNSLLVDGRKVSGTAQFTQRERLLSHATLLVDTDLDPLRRSLQPRGYVAETTGLASVPHSVRNLALDEDDMAGWLAAAYGAGDEASISADDRARIEALADRYRSWGWVYGRSPKTWITCGHRRMLVEKGRITQAWNHERPVREGQGARAVCAEGVLLQWLDEDQSSSVQAV